jgi:hypothetical protein
MEPELICVLCGRPWLPKTKNKCECGGMCSWGYEMGKPLSYSVTENGKWVPNPVDTSINENFSEDEML